MADSDVSGTDPVADSDTPRTSDAPDTTVPSASEAPPAQAAPATSTAPDISPLVARVDTIAQAVDRVLSAIDELKAGYVDNGGVVREDNLPGANTAQGLTQDAAGVNQESDLARTQIEDLDFTI